MSAVPVVKVTVELADNVVIKTRLDGTVEWWRAGVLHREDGPAVTYPDGSSMWFVAGVPTRVEWSSGANWTSQT